jgi:hypothetical protein
VLLVLGLLGYIIDLAITSFPSDKDLALRISVLALGGIYRLYSILVVRSCYYDFFAANGYDLGLGLLTGESKI